MQYFNLLNIKLSHIQIFLCAAKYENFTKAANQLYLTQSMVSKSINNIENELGIFLFIRTSDGIKLTPAGRQLYLEWEHIIKNFEITIENANFIQKGLNSRLRIGNSALASSNLFITEKATILTEKYSDITIDLEQHTLSTLLEKVNNDRLDIIFTSMHELSSIKGLGLKWRLVQDSNLSIFIHKSNILFEKETVDFGDLHSENFIVLSPESHPSYIALLNSLAEKYGFTPRISCYVPNITSFKANLELGKGVVLADNKCDICSNDIKKFDFNDIKNGIIAAWKKDNSKKYFKEFLALY